MASIINAATSGGLISTADTSGILQLQTAGTTAVTVDASQNVGVGTSSPAGKLDVGNVAGAVSTGDFIVTTGSTTASVTVGRLSSTGSDNTTFNVRNRVGTSLFYVSPDGVKTNNTISVGAATPSTSGAGITFPATQSASTDPQTLDDYEEGTWTPVFAFGTSGSVTYSTQAGYYRKVGSLVFVECNIIIASVSSPTGNVTVNNLPFSVSSSTENLGSLAIGIVRNLVNAKPDIKAYCPSSTTQIYFPVNDTISGPAELLGSDLKASTLIYCSGCFIAN
jgi:hypothetical protein